MFIKIRYEATWRNSFLDGSNNEAIPQGGRKFIASMTELKKEGNYKTRQISKDTVMGVLNRLIGDQRKLYQARNYDDYYFKEIESILTDDCIKDIPEITQELVYIRNITSSTDQNSWTGEILENHVVFNSDFSPEFWSTLWLTQDELVKLIINTRYRVTPVDTKLINPRTISERAIFIQKNIRKIEPDDRILEAIKILSQEFSNQEYIESDGKVKLERLFAGALYLQLDRLSQYYNMTNAAKNERGNRYVYGFSKRGFNGYRDLMKNFITGSEKLIFGNPYLLKQRIPGEGEITKLLSKASGLLEIDLKISREQALDLQEKIDCAGVSSFYLGKKGLAYVEDIRT